MPATSETKRKYAIPQSLLRDWIETETERKHLAKEARAIETSQRAIKQDIIAILKSTRRNKVQPGKLSVVLCDGRRNVPWKQVVIDLKGNEYASKLTQATEPSKDIKVS